MSIFQSRIKDQIVKSTSGIKVITESNEYIDGISGMFNMIFGYSCQSVKKCIINSLKILPFHPKEHFYSSKLLETSEVLLEKSKMTDGGVLFLNGGSEAVEAALFMSIQYHKRMGNNSKRKIITRAHSYHGATLGARSVTGRNNFRDIIVSGFDTIRVSASFKTVDNGVEQQPDTVKSIEAKILREDPETIAAFIIEPVNHLKGMQQTQSGYLLGIRALCDKYNILLITDEIISGMHRTGAFLNTHKAKLYPDIVVLGKGLSAGYTPVSAIIATQKVSDVFDGNGKWKSFSYSHTYASNPIGISAVWSTLKYLNHVISSKNFIDLNKIFSKKVKSLNNLVSVERSENYGLIAGITLNSELGSDAGKRLENECFKNGLIIRGEEDWVTIVPSYCTQIYELEKIFQIIRSSIKTTKFNQVSKR